jgi:GNAT superfamily N-acetyltransferase
VDERDAAGASGVEELMSYEIVPYRADLVPEVARLQTRLWSSDPELNARYFHWKYERNPYERQPLVYLALQDGRAVAMRGLYGSRWECGPRREVFAPLVADDMVVAPEHANRRLVSRIMRAAFAEAAGRGCSHLLNLSGGVVTVFGSLAMGWKSAGTVNPVALRSGSEVRFLRAQGILARLPLVWRYATRAALHPGSERALFRRLDRAAHDDLPISLEREPRPAAMADLVERLGHDGRLRHVRDQAFFAWRYANPLHEYRFVFCGDQPLEGYLVLQRSVSDRSARFRVRIVDLEAATVGAREGMLRWVVTAGRFPEVVTWTASASPEVRHLFEAAGFRPTEVEKTARGVGCVLVRPLVANPTARDWTLGGLNLLDLANWDLRLVYSMQG